MSTELKQTLNRGKIKGRLSEKKLEYFKDKKGNIGGIKGSIIIDSAVGKHELGVYSSALKKDGNPNPMYDNILALKNDYVAEIDVTEDKPANFVEADFQLQVRDYVSQKTGKLVTGAMSLSLNTINRISEEKANDITEDDNVIVLTAMYNKMTPLSEKDRENEGDKNLEVFGVSFTGAIMPYNLYVEEEFVEDVEEIYKKGDTVQITVEPRKFHVAGRQKKAAAFGKTANLSKGYDRVRFALIGGEGVIEESDDMWLDPELVDKALKERETMLNDLEKGGNKNQNKAVAKASAKIKDEDIPF